MAERKLLTDAFDASGAFIQILDPNFNILAINKANVDEYERIFGIRPAVGDNLSTLLASMPKQQEAAIQHFSRALAGEQFTVDAEFGDGVQGTRCYEIRFSPLYCPEGRLVGAYHFSQDVTDRKREQKRLADVEKQLRQSQKMEAIGALTGGVAHDFNNLLTPIIGNLDILLRRNPGSEREQRLIKGAMQAADRAATLVQRLLAFARQQPLRPRPVDIGALVNGMADIVGCTSGPQIKVAITVDHGLPTAVADPNQIEMAILNLAVNGCDAMPQGGTLRISAVDEIIGGNHRTRLDPGRYVCLSVADTGTGMDETTIRRAVEPFYSTKGVGQGTGLGLSMAHGLAAQLGGALTIDSEPGIGTDVRIWLPAAVGDAPDAPDDAVDAPPPGAAVRTVLLVDDTDMVRASTAMMLSDLGYTVVEAGSAADALRLVEDGLHIDVLVTDHLMPGMSGTELARSLQQRFPSLQVLIVSGYIHVDDVAPDLPRLIKPFRQSQLAARLAERDG